MKSHRTTVMLLSLLMCLYSLPLFPAAMVLLESESRVRVFYTEDHAEGWSAVLKGKVNSVSVREDAHKSEISRVAQDKTKVTVRLYSSEGIKAGDFLFIINDRNLIVARVEVKSFFHTQAFGYMLIGYGNFRLVKNDYRVVQRIEDENSKYAFIYKARGDYYSELGDTGEAIKFYKKAVESDRGNPEAHIALGYIYLNDNMPEFAMREFFEAYKNIGRLYDNEDKYLLLKGMAATRFKEAYHYRIPKDLRAKFIKEGIQYSMEALKIYPESKEVNYYLGMFYFKNPDPSDKDARNQFLKVIELDPENIDAFISLAELYYNHKNKEKARFYAEQALKIDGANERARFILSLTK